MTSHDSEIAKAIATAMGYEVRSPYKGEEFLMKGNLGDEYRTELAALEQQEGI